MERTAFFTSVAGTALVAAMAMTNCAPASAQEDHNTYYGLVVNGSPSLDITYTAYNGTLIVRNVRHAAKAAGKPSNYFAALPPGTMAFPDRPLRAGEPTAIELTATPEVAQIITTRLHENDGFWYFYVRNTGRYLYAR